MIHFMGDSYAAVTLKEAAHRRGLHICEKPQDACLLFISQDTPTDSNGERDSGSVYQNVIAALRYSVPIVLTSQVIPGFTRQFNSSIIYHQAETLRIEDGIQRAMFPEMFMVGAATSQHALAGSYEEYLRAFDCPILRMTYEDAEFAKISINMTLAAQVDNANRLSAAAAKCGADWGRVSRALRHDSRIGRYSYLTPGRWQDSRHLLRDAVTLAEIEEK